jgi:hypothetical protein
MRDAMASKKTALKETDGKKADEKKADGKKADGKKAGAAKPMARSDVKKELAARSGLEVGQVTAVLEALRALARRELGKKGPGLFALPNLVRLRRVKTPARKAGKRPNPFKPGEMMAVKAKPASVKVKPAVLKGLKDLAAGS